MSRLDLCRNDLAVSLSWPPIIIKDTKQADRARHYAALEAGEQGELQGGCPATTRAALERAVQKGDFPLMQDLLVDGVIPQLDTLLAAAVEAGSPLWPLSELAIGCGVQGATLRQ